MLVRRLLGILLSVAAGLAASLGLAAVRERPLHPDAVENGLVAAVPAALVVAALGRWRGRRTARSGEGSG